MIGAPGLSRPARIGLHVVVVAVGMALGAVAGLVGAVAWHDSGPERPCEPRDGEGCAGGMGLLVVAFGMPLGGMAGAAVAHRLMRRAR